MTPKEGKREQKERGLSGSTNSLYDHRHARTSPSPRALHTAMQRATHTTTQQRGMLSSLNTGASLEQIAPHPRRPSLGPSRSLDRLSQVLPHPSFGRGGGTKPLQYRAAANPPAVAPSSTVSSTYFQVPDAAAAAAHSRAALSHSVPDEPGLLPSPLASHNQLRGPARQALSRPPFSLDGLSVGPANWARPQVPASARVWSDGTVMDAVGRKRRRRTAVKAAVPRSAALQDWVL